MAGIIKDGAEGTMRRLTLADVYRRLVDADSWEDVDALKRDVADTLSADATDEGRETAHLDSLDLDALNALIDTALGASRLLALMAE